MGAKIPVPDAQTGLLALRAMLHQRHPLAALQVFNEQLGDIFRVNLPGFTPVVMVGPQAAHFVLVEARRELRWRNATDPVTRLLRHGVLVEDGAAHDELRRALSPALHRRMLAGYIESFWRCAGQVSATWPQGGVVDMLVEMRKIALLALMDTLYAVDYTPELERLWKAVLGCIHYISPGLWMVWKGAPRPGYQRWIATIDAYLLQIIHARRRLLAGRSEPPLDMLGLLVFSGMEDGLIRDQLLTMLIAGHDTVTALLAWTLYLLGAHPMALDAAAEQAQVTLASGAVPTLEQIQRLDRLERAIKEALRLYPPIHLGSRVAAVDLDFNGYTIPQGERVIYSIYLTQRQPAAWPDPDSFIPDRHLGAAPAAYTWLAFGGGPRNCIGAAFGQLEAVVVLGRLLAEFDLRLQEKRVLPYMGATLEPRPGVRMRVWRRG